MNYLPLFPKVEIEIQRFVWKMHFCLSNETSLKSLITPNNRYSSDVCQQV